jgi:hypothetical protein
VAERGVALGFGSFSGIARPPFLFWFMARMKAD